MAGSKCIGILTSGGDAPGMNAAIRAVTRSAIYNGFTVKGIMRGYKGLVYNEIVEFKSQSVSNIIQLGGTILKTARSQEFTTAEGRKAAYDNMVAAGINALVVIGGWQGVFITVLQWAMVLFGIFYKSLSRKSIPAVSLTIYLVMGWTIVFFLPLFVRQASTALLVLIAAGGVLYTLGAWFYARQGFRYHHMVWHLLINLAVVAHFIGIVFFLY